MENRNEGEMECERKEKKKKERREKIREIKRERKKRAWRKKKKNMTYLCSSLSICFAREILFLMEDI